MSVAIAALVPVAAGFVGLVPAALGLTGDAEAQTHLSYLSGLLLGIGLAFYSLIPGIERRGGAFRLLTALVLAGGLARLYTALRLGIVTPLVTGPLAMELIVTPLLCLWQMRVARRG